MIYRSADFVLLGLHSGARFAIKIVTNASDFATVDDQLLFRLMLVAHPVTTVSF